MILIEKLSDYINKSSIEEFVILTIKIYQMTNSISNDCPNYTEWFFTKQIPGIFKKNREILFVRNLNNQEEIIAMACLKKSEAKICTLFVSEKFRNLGIGSAVIEESMNYLDTTEPFITLPNYKLSLFEPIIKKYNWKLTNINNRLSDNKTKELCFNRNKKLHT